jgi:mono/diheme cytochrome c family protein
MRMLLARLLALVTTTVIVVVAVAFALLMNTSQAQTPEGPDVLDPTKIQLGTKVYAVQRCSSCHSIDGQGNRRYPLDGVGSRLGREIIRMWIVEPQKVQPGVRKRGFTQLSAEDLDGLVTYMLSLKEKKSSGLERVVPGALGTAGV